LGPERFRAPEILFSPELVGEEASGVHQVVVDSINRADLDLRKNLFSNIVLSGGSTLCKGYGDRLLNEVKRLALKDIKVSWSIDLGFALNHDADQDIRAAGTEVFDMDRWLDSGRPQYLQKTLGIGRGELMTRIRKSSSSPLAGVCGGSRCEACRPARQPS
jgi:hypothetical protein